MHQLQTGCKNTGAVGPLFPLILLVLH